MSVRLENVTRGDFKYNNCPILFEDANANNRFALITKGKYSYRLAWHSDLINPVILEINSNVVSIGVDQNFAIIDFNNNSILFNLNLIYNFLNVFLFKDWIFIVTELEIIKVGKNIFQVLEEYALPDLFEEIFFKGDRIEVRSADNNIIEIGNLSN